jgi:hypothetical protein
MTRGFAIAPGCFLALCAASAGCPGTLEDPERFLAADGGLIAQGQPADEGGISGEGGGSNCPDVPQTLSTTCTGAGCHNAMDKAQGLDLQSPNLASRLVGVQATEGPGLLIDPSNPSASVLYLKVTGSPPFGSRMPQGRAPLDDATIACVLAWVTQQVSPSGSSNDGGADDGGGSAEGGD